jgi:Histidine kinase-, DNA gyrase B-, and HSP90-like ATPase
MIREIDSFDATPSKRIYHSIIADYDLKTAVCELIDNAVDAWRSFSKNDQLKIIVDIDTDQQSVLVQDNACGVKKEDLKTLITPGETSLDGIRDPIGFFGVGSKRAVVAIAQHIQISTRYENEKTYRVQYDDEWINDAGNWSMPYYEIADINANTTKIELLKLRFKIEEEHVIDLKAHLSATHANFIIDDNIQILVNGEKIEGTLFSQWAFPNEFTPTCFIRTLPVFKTTRDIRFELTYGLTHEKGASGADYGVFFYCNRRLIARALKSPEVGFARRFAGIPHPSMSLARVSVMLYGSSEDMPWTSNKAGINYNHATFQTIKNDITEAIILCTRFSKILLEDFERKVEPYKEGVIVEKKLGITEDIKNKLPSIPKTRRDYKEDILSLNKALGSLKPWTKGLYEALIAEESISRHKILTQKNRISLILLDSTIEIACKEYLANETSGSISEEKLREYFKNRITVHNKVEEHVLSGDPIWYRFRHYYNLRCDLIHKKASVGVPDDDIENFRNDVKFFLEIAFGMRFPVP